MFTLRLLRRRWVLGLILLGSFTYFVISTFFWKKRYNFGDDYTVHRSVARQPFQWQPRPDNSQNVSTLNSCRNSVQGKRLIADEKGYVCARKDVLANGCCDTNRVIRSRHSCHLCQKNGCCAVYEYCISCCLHTNKKVILWRILKEGQDASNPVFMQVRDHFELCLTKCRTSSQSVQHENSYRNAKYKHCYGESLPSPQ